MTDIQVLENDRERRNLMLCSVALNAYYFAGGEISAEGARLMWIGINFTKPEALTWMAWGMLFWFAWRYWQTTPDLLVLLSRDIQDFNSKNYIQNFLKRIPKEGGIDGHRIDCDGWRFIIQTTHSYEGVRNSNRAVPARLCCRIWCSQILENRWFSYHIVPYVVLAFAVASPCLSSYI